MVMKPEPWGEALDEVLPDGATLVVPTPSGTPFTQALARELAGQERLVFACGRYEGIDQRVVDEARARADVREVSIGDYVLNGGEVAALAITEAVVRLLPGFMGNPGSLLEESHEDGLLEYPVYTKPASWRGRDVPPVLLSGDHAAVAAWRHEQSVRRTAERRPDLVHRSTLLDDVEVRLVEPADAGELFVLQRACWVQEQQDNPGVLIPALEESLDDLRAWIGAGPGARRPVGRPPGRRGPGQPARRGVGHRAADGRARRGRPRSGPDAARPDRGGRPARGHVVRAVHGCRLDPQPADVQEGGLPAPRRDRARRGPDDQAALRRSRTISVGAPPLWQTCSSAQSAKQGWPEDSFRGDPRQFLPQGEHDAAGHTHWVTTERHSNSAADLWHP